MAAADRAVVVGVDGSENSFTAADWAISEAQLRGTPLHIVVANDDPARSEYAERVAREAAARCWERAAEVLVTEETVAGRPVDQLLGRCGSAHMLVVGSRGLGGFANSLLGSVSSSVATHAQCPVVVVPHGTQAVEGSVVVGLDNSPESSIALRFAFEAAAERETELMAVEAWREEGLLTLPLPPPDRDEVQRRIESGLTDQLADWGTEYPHVTVHERALHGHPVAVLTNAARNAQLLVVGHRGRGGFTGLFLGSVALGTLHHAQCPVAVVRAL